MRVSQIQNLTWVANVLILAGVGWVGLQFWNTRKAKPAKEVEWPKLKAEGADQPRWPGELASFAHIWTTPVGGKVPPPPAAVVREEKKVDKAAEFKAKLKYMGGWEYPTEPWRSPVRVNFDGKDLSISPGSTVGGFQLQVFTYDGEKRTYKLVFRYLGADAVPDVVIEGPQSQGPSPTGPGNEPLEKHYEKAVEDGRIKKEGPLEHTAWRPDPANPNTWVIPEDEQAWIEAYGEEIVWPKLSVKPDVDAQGVSHGLRITSIPEAGTPLAPTHGIAQGDVVRTINGVEMTSKEDVLIYLRGAGKGLSRYEVLVDNDGAKRTIVYQVPRRAGHRQD